MKKRKTVTRSLKKTLNKLGIKYGGCFSDTRKNRQAVGVKFVGLDLDEETIIKIVRKMEKKGYMENKKGKMVKKADMLTARMSKKKKGKIMKGKR